eukprot:864347-Rhodomonas_salina.1
MSSTAGHGTDTGGAMSPAICVRALQCRGTQAPGGRVLRPYPDPQRQSRRSTCRRPPLFGLWSITMADPSATRQELDKKTPRTSHG